MTVTKSNPSDDADVADLIRFVLEDRAEFYGARRPTQEQHDMSAPFLVRVLMAPHHTKAMAPIVERLFLHYPWIRWNHDGKALDRDRYLHLARRVAGDDAGLDLAFLMAASRMGHQVTFGWVPRFVNAVFDQAFADGTGIFTGAQVRAALTRLVYCYAAHTETRYRDVWTAISDEHWSDDCVDGYLLDIRNDRKFFPLFETIEMLSGTGDETDTEIIEPSWVKPASMKRTTLDILRAIQDPEIPPERRAPHVVVVPRGAVKLMKPYDELPGQRIELAVAGDVVAARSTLLREYPYADSAIDRLLADARADAPLRLRPILLLGDPGAGKSRLVRRMAELLDVPLRRFDGAGAGDNAFGGTPKRWSSAEPCFPLLAVVQSRFANPIVMIDEVDKAATSTHNGSLTQALMPFLERETSRRYPDPGLQVEIDLSHVSYLCTANNIDAVPKALLDRCRIVRMPAPGPEHLPHLAGAVLADVAEDMGTTPEMLGCLAQDELEAIERAWSRAGRSIRRLRQIVEVVVTERERMAMRH
jgi:hypothetical protein